ncbi:MAG: type II toxin-antitoxin system VapC family toxin [Bacteroidota bacterium]
MKKLLVDAGPLIALFDRHDQHHDRVVKQLERFDELLSTTWPVITEVSHMLDFSIQAQLDFLEWIQIGGLELISLDRDDVVRIGSLMEKYEDVPMDLADASLIVASEQLRTNRILSIDSDFQVFRNRYKNMLVNELKL